MSNASHNPFADAVRRVASSAGAVASGTLRASMALGTALLILTAPVAMTASNVISSPTGIPGAASLATAAVKTAADAKLQAQLSEYYACGLLKITKADLSSFGASHGIDRIRTVAHDTIAGGAALPHPETGFSQTVSNMAEMAGTLGMAGLSKVVDSVVSSPASNAWSKGWVDKMSALPTEMAQRSRKAGIERDAYQFQHAAAEVDASISTIGCKI